MIFSYLQDGRDLAACYATCRQWRRILQGRGEGPWRQLCLLHGMLAEDAVLAKTEQLAASLAARKKRTDRLAFREVGCPEERAYLS